MFLLPRKCTRDNGLIEFRYKILHRYLPTNTLLFKMKVIETTSCTFCNLYQESVLHLFYECLDVKNLWFQVENILIQVKKEPITLSGADVLFGYHLKTFCKKTLTINNIILHTKMFIWLCKTRSTTPSYLEYIS